MMEKIYKYFSSDVLNLVFARQDFCGLKCSFPKDYSDPFELFLGVDLGVSTDLLATYREIVTDLPQHPTTCFSKSPVVAPMWAHYANNHSGFILEFDAESLQKTFENSGFGDVAYKDTPDPIIGEYLARSAVTMKPRHAVWLQRAVHTTAYFSKLTTWSYEQERRLVVSEEQIENIHESMILFVPINCVTAIAIGSKFPKDARVGARKIAEDNDLAFYETLIGKSNSLPFFTDGQKDAFVFDGNGIVEAGNVCEKCSEPIDAGENSCAWCKITDAHEQNAAAANPFRILDHFGILDRYFEGVEEIERGRYK